MSCYSCGFYPCTCPIRVGWPQATGPTCECPTAWWGLYPPPCPVHNPPVRTYVGTTTLPWPPAPTPLSDEDVDRIARRLKQLLDAGKSEP